MENAIVKELTDKQCQQMSDYLIKTLTGKLYGAKVHVDVATCLEKCWRNVLVHGELFCSKPNSCGCAPRLREVTTGTVFYFGDGQFCFVMRVHAICTTVLCLMLQAQGQECKRHRQRMWWSCGYYTWWRVPGSHSVP